MRASRYCCALGPVALTLLLAAGGGAATLELKLAPGYVRIQAQDIALAEILKAISERTGIRMVLDAEVAARPVSGTLEARGLPGAIEELVRRAGGGSYVMLYPTGAAGTFATFPFSRRKPGPPSPTAPLPTPAAEGWDAGAAAGSSDVAPEALGLPAPPMEPMFIPVLEEPADLAPVSEPVHVLEMVEPVYLAPLAEPQYVPDLPSQTQQESTG
jgi:hypothetical protein